MTEVATPERRLFELSCQLETAQKAEEFAKEQRIRVEEEIVKATGFSKPAGSQSFATDGAFGSAKLTLKQNVYVSVIEDRIPAVKKSLGSNLFWRCFSTKHAPVAKAIAALEKSNRDLYLEAAVVIQRKPGKVSVELKTLVVI
jgi:hypothetical protein